MIEMGDLTPLTLFLIAAMAVVVVLLLVLWFSMRRGTGRAASAPRERVEPGLSTRIDLVPHEGGWHRTEAAAIAARLRAMGFEEVGRFAVPQMAPMQLWAGTQDETGFAAMVYDHPQMATFFDLVRAYTDGRSCTVTSSPTHDPAHLPPGNACIADPELSPEDAFDTLLAQPLEGTPQKVGPANFVGMFTAQYARAMDHILSPPQAAPQPPVGRAVEPSSPPAQPVAPVAPVPPPPDDTLMRHAVDLERQSRLQTLADAIGARLVESGDVDAGVWARLKGAALCVHDLLTAEEAAGALVGMSADPDTARNAATAALALGLPPIDTVEALLAALPEPLRPQLLGEVDHPLYAQVYAPVA